MKVMAINGGPRKTWNTATLLNKALEGAASEGAETELVHLYDIDFKGCTSCFACKVKNGKSYGKCAYKDELSPVLIKAMEADALLIGSPIYIGMVTGEMKSFLERLLFPLVVYDENHSSLLDRKIPTGFICTMGATESRMREMGYDQHARLVETLLAMFLGPVESLVVNDTYQFDDYSKYVSTRFDPVAKAKRRKEVFPLDCEKAFELGVRLAKR